MIVLIAGGGPASELPDFKKWQGAKFIGADAGAVALMEQGITPDAAAGDFDSVSPEALAELKKAVPDLRFAPTEKDETDLELSLLLAAEYRPETVIVTGVTGGRLDHFLSALHLMHTFQLKYPGTEYLMEDRYNRIRFLQAGDHVIEGDPAYRYISFYPFHEEAEGVSLTGFKYEVSGDRVAFGSSRFTSNELQGGGTISIRSGSCLMIESNDKHKKMPG
ncbi:thiamine diphosphokinase [Indiicoccus explosivorum]|uniref:thiamine diphosphokinase n=1 Tax=Indiicoccus explosivorum TaxID=1917864 RepID=UPI000B432BC5|nr:thiamine diphosphokinase [Indiicoccus explosivorum]